MRKAWKSLPIGVRKTITLSAKAAATVGAFYLLLTHKVDDGEGHSITVVSAIRDHLATMQWQTFVPYLLLATGIKFVGIFASMVRWHLLLIGQGIRFNFFHIVGSFLIGRFLGTFLPSTVGLDGYKLYDASRFSKRPVEAAAATVVEKVMGLSGVFMTFLVTLPLGIVVLGDAAGPVAAITVPIALVIICGLFITLFRPGFVQWGLRLLPSMGRAKLKNFIEKTSHAAAAYRGKAGLLGSVIVLSFFVHFFTAAMYYFTALAVGAVSAPFWQVTFASSIQIFATVVSPFTIGGEGIREIVQHALLSHEIGSSESFLSAALGFLAAEAMTLVGVFFWWGRRSGYTPKRMELVPQDEAANPDNDGAATESAAA